MGREVILSAPFYHVKKSPAVQNTREWRAIALWNTAAIPVEDREEFLESDES